MADGFRHRGTGPSGTNSGKVSAGCSKAWLASEHRASISPAASSQRRTAASDCARQSSTVQSEVRRPENEGLQDADEDVVAGIQALHQAVEAGQAARRRRAGGIERCAKRAQPREWKCSRSRRTSTSESRPSSWAASSTAATTRPGWRAAVEEPAVDQRRQEEIAEQRAGHPAGRSGRRRTK